MGGIALGEGVKSSGLFNAMDAIVRDLVNGYRLYTVVLILSPVVLVSVFFHRSPSSASVPPLGHFHLHQSHDSERATRSHSKRSRRKPTRESRGCPCLHHRTHLFRRHGDAGVRISEPNCVRVSSLVPFVYHRHIPCGNQRATQEDELGELYLTNIDFLKNGVPSSIIATLVG
jgi:phosphate transporter